MQQRDLFVEMLRQHMHLPVVMRAVGPEFDLRQHLVGEARRHHEARMPRRATEVHQPALRQEDQPLAVREFHFVHLRLDIAPGEVAQRVHLDLIVEMADIADDRAVLHGAHMVNGHDIGIAGRRHHNVHTLGDIVQAHHLVAGHAGLQRADRVDLADHHPGALAAQALGRALADIAIAADQRGLAGDHHIGGALDPVHKALAAAVEIVEFRLCHRIVDIEGRAGERPRSWPSRRGAARRSSSPPTPPLTPAMSSG